MTTERINVEVAIIGAGPAGLTAAAAIAAKGVQVVVFDRESQAGGIPRHSDHPGYGIRDMGKFTTGPKYAGILRDRALSAGAEVRTNSTVTDWTGEQSFNVTAPTGRYEVSAQAVILATGARERPRPARMIPGDRGAGVLTTGLLQNLVHVKHKAVGKRAVIVGAELVSWSAALTLKHAGCKTVLLTTEHAKPDAYAAFTIPGKIFFGTKVATRSRVVSVIGKPRVTAVEIEDMDSGKRTVVDCDTVVFTGGWIPDNELARAAGVDLDHNTRGPIVDASFRTNIPGVFAVGNMLHPVDTADVAALDGAAAADAVIDYIRSDTKVSTESVRVTAGPSLAWVSPGILRTGDQAPARNRILAWARDYRAFPVVVARQAGVEIHRKRLLWPAAPGRVFRIPAGLLDNVDIKRGDISIDIA